MIPVAQITQWREIAPWPDDMQVEQDLILSRMIVEIFSDPFLREELSFRGGTALHKMFFSPAARYHDEIKNSGVNYPKTSPSALDTHRSADHAKMASRDELVRFFLNLMLQSKLQDALRMLQLKIHLADQRQN